MDPLVEYQHEGFDMFMDMVTRMKREMVERMLRTARVAEDYHARNVYAGGRAQDTESSGAFDQPTPAPAPRRGPGPDEAVGPMRGSRRAPAEPVRHDAPKVGRNDPCPCGSGKKFKKCCGG